VTAAPVGVEVEAPLARRRPLARKVWVGAAIIGIYALVGLLAPLVAPRDPLAQDPVNRLIAPSGGHLLGTDELGRDELSRLIYAARTDLPIAAFAVLLPCLLGTALGALAGFMGRFADLAVMRLSDLVQAFPLYILMIALVFALGPGVRSLLISFTAVGWVVYARLIRSEIMRLKELDYIAAARVAGLSPLRILTVHIRPNAIGQTIVYAMSDLVFAILALASFSFLGLGVPPPRPEWGAMIAAGQDYIAIAWWPTVLPGLAIAGIALGLSLIGDGLQDRMRH
jgi:peptide/nickel transport system permease protein